MKRLSQVFFAIVLCFPATSLFAANGSLDALDGADAKRTNTCDSSATPYYWIMEVSASSSSYPGYDTIDKNVIIGKPATTTTLDASGGGTQTCWGGSYPGSNFAQPTAGTTYYTDTAILLDGTNGHDGRLPVSANWQNYNAKPGDKFVDYDEESTATTTCTWVDSGSTTHYGVRVCSLLQ
jgi:hypothetical protein